MRQRLQFAARLLGWGVLTLIVLELCARGEDKLRFGASFFRNYSIDTLYDTTPQGKFGHPHASYLKWHLNEVGFRGPALRADTYRIVCMGSSETFGLYESPGMEWPRQLETVLDEEHPRGQPYEVINAAYPGMSLATNLRRLPATLESLQPKMVVLYPSYTPYIGVDHAYVAGAAQPATRVSNAVPEWRIAGRFDTLMKASIPESVQHWMRGVELRHAGGKESAIARLPEQNILAFEGDLDQLTGQLQARGIRVVLVTHANRFGARNSPEDRPYLTDWRKFFPTLEEDGFLDMEQRMSEAVRQVGRARGVSVVDAANEVPPGKENFAEFVHFTDAGAHTLAELVAAQVLKEGQGTAATGTAGTP